MKKIYQSVLLIALMSTATLSANDKPISGLGVWGGYSLSTIDTGGAGGAGGISAGINAWFGDQLQFGGSVSRIGIYSYDTTILSTKYSYKLSYFPEIVGQVRYFFAGGLYAGGLVGYGIASAEVCIASTCASGTGNSGLVLGGLVGYQIALTPQMAIDVWGRISKTLVSGSGIEITPALAFTYKLF